MNDKKSILICSHSMEIGGAERSLLDLLYSLDTEKYDVDLFLYRHSGEWMKDIPENINLLPESSRYASILLPMKSLLRLRQYGVLGCRLLGKIAAACYQRAKRYKHSDVAIEYSHKFTRFCMPPIHPGKTYDLAVSFLTPHYYVSEKVNARRKAAWIHTDYSAVSIDEKSERKMWSRYPFIVSISENCTRAFQDRFPGLQDRILQIENILSDTFIRQKAKEPVEDGLFDDTCINLLSVGRFSEAKNFDNIPEICRLIQERGWRIRWYLIGYGPDEGLIRRKIREHHAESEVILLGKKENPYPYMKRCDVYIQPSRYEGKSVAVREAQILGKPVIITDFVTARSQLLDGQDGVIVPKENPGCAEGICRVLSDAGFMEQLSRNCLNSDYTNAGEIAKLYKLLE